jgi:hypothetical protein
MTTQPTHSKNTHKLNELVKDLAIEASELDIDWGEDWDTNPLNKEALESFKAILEKYADTRDSL